MGRRRGETARVGHEELTEDGVSVARPPPPRPDGPARYGDRFGRATGSIDLGPTGRRDTVDLGVEVPSRTWPSWLTRGAAVLGLVATAAVAVATEGRVDAPPAAAHEASPAQSDIPNDLAPFARLYASRVEGELWDHGRFSYEVTLSPSGAAFRLDVASGVSGEDAAACTYLGGAPRFGWVYWC